MHPIRKQLFAILVAAISSLIVYARPGITDSTGLPGDNFDLQGALQMFQKATSPENFEKLLNTRDNDVNNLDLNADGETDYIRVINKMEKDVHAFILQVPVSQTENQDIAVIEIEKTGDTTAILQIIGDEDIYGEQVIIEPAAGGEDDAFLNGWNDANNSGPASDYRSVPAPRFIINVWYWPTVRFVYTPFYRPWVSPWKWRYYPVWWKPWRPMGWHVWHPRRMRYHRNFVVVRTHRVGRAHACYTPFRASSVSVRARHGAAVNNYRVTRTKTTVSGPRGRSATKTTTTVSGKNGRVKGSKTTVRKRRN